MREALRIQGQTNLTYANLGRAEYVITKSPKAGVTVKPKTTILLYYDEAATLSKGTFHSLSSRFDRSPSYLRGEEIDGDGALQLATNGSGLLWAEPAPERLTIGGYCNGLFCGSRYLKWNKMLNSVKNNCIISLFIFCERVRLMKLGKTILEGSPC